MTFAKKTILTLLIAAVITTMLPVEAQADGPLRRWLRGLRKPSCNTCSMPGNQPGAFAPQQFSPTLAGNNTAPNAYGLQPGQCMKTCQQTCSRTVVNYVPYTAYRDNWTRVPVTQYKPVTNSDPCTGCTVTCMKPCTTYTYQMQRVPYTTYRPVYRQETYKVPVTTITNDCATGNCATGTCSTEMSNPGCDTCNTPTYAQGSMVAPMTGMPQPTFAAPLDNSVPANVAPTLSGYAPNANYAPGPGYQPVTSGYLPAAPAAPATTTTRSYETPNGTLMPSGSYRQPAEMAPVLDMLQNPQGAQRITPTGNRFTQQLREPAFGGNTDSWNSPAQIDYQPRSAQSPVRQQFGYSPVRFASHSDQTIRSDSSYNVGSRLSEADINRSNGWEEVN